MVIAVVALLLAVGGPASGKINGRKLKDKSVSGDKIMDKTITGGQVADGALTGQQIDESTLETVPSAAAAASASALVGSFNAGIVNANVGETKHLLTLGPFSIEGRCAATTARIFMTTSVDDANVYSDSVEYDNNDFDVNVEAEIGYPADQSTNHVAFYSEAYSGWIAVAPNASAVFRGSAYSAKDFLGAPCTFMVVGTQLK
jgi:hypothetical protein